MHEHGIADRLIIEALALADQRGYSQIDRIILGIGALSGVSSESLEEPFRHASEECGLSHVTFTFEKILPTAVCRTCKKEIGQAYACPTCNDHDIEVVAGADLLVLDIEGR